MKVEWEATGEDFYEATDGSLIEHLKKIYLLFGEKKKRNILLLFFLFTIISLFELISVGFIYPFLAILVDFETFSSNYSYYLEILNLNNQREVILFAGFFMT